MKTAEIDVALLDHMGSDLTVVNAARVSMDKFHAHFQDNDENLIAYLAQNNHWSPFAHAFMQFRVKAPIFVARQLGKSTVGLAWNEVSRRYVDSEPEFYLPSPRKRAENVKQGSLDELADEINKCYDIIDMTLQVSLDSYNELLDEDVAPEVARSVLPQAMMTEWIWSGSLYAFARVCNLRLDSHAQKESREVALKIYREMKELFPISTRWLIGWNE